MSQETNSQGRNGLHRTFRKLSVADRRSELRALVSKRLEESSHSDNENAPVVDFDTALGPLDELVELADVMVESAVGYLALPLGVATGFLIDGERIDIPMATEEPSVIAAATYAAAITARVGGIATSAGEPITTGQIFLENCDEDAPDRIEAARDRIVLAMKPIISRMERRGGGLRGIDAVFLPETGLVRVEFHLDVRDAMGGNIVNTVGEAIEPVVESIAGGQVLMAVLTNAADYRLFGATARIPVSQLGRAGIDGPDIARRIALASDVAQEDGRRAVTHNKGIMNGITALALATGNDTRALEAAAHSYAAESGRYVGLATYRVTGGYLIGTLKMPIVLGSVGGASGIHPTSRYSLVLLGNPTAVRLSRIAAALGLAQNFAALYALVGEGIQRGHMTLHARGLAWSAGARGSERNKVAQIIADRGVYNMEAARDALRSVRGLQDIRRDSSR